MEENLVYCNRFQKIEMKQLTVNLFKKITLQIFFNHKCYPSTFFPRGRIANLPKTKGPGPVQLVMQSGNILFLHSFEYH